MQVGHGVGILARSDRRGLYATLPECGLRTARADRRIMKPHQGNPGIGHSASFPRHKGCDARDGKITTSLRKLLEAPSGCSRQSRQIHRNNDFIRRQHGGQRGGKEIPRRDLPLSIRTGGNNLCIQQHRHHRQFSRRVGMGQAAADGSTITDCKMRHVFHRFVQYRKPVPDRHRRLQRKVPGERADSKAAVFFFFYPVEPFDAIDIDE